MCSPDRGGRTLSKLLKGSNSARQSMSALQSFASEIFPVQEIVFVRKVWLHFCMENAVCFLNKRDLSHQHCGGLREDIVMKVKSEK